MYSKYRPLLPQIARKNKHNRKEHAYTDVTLSNFCSFVSTICFGRSLYTSNVIRQENTSSLLIPTMSLQSSLLCYPFVTTTWAAATMQEQRYKIILLLYYNKVQFKSILTEKGQWPSGEIYSMSNYRQWPISKIYSMSNFRQWPSGEIYSMSNFRQWLLRWICNPPASNIWICNPSFFALQMLILGDGRIIKSDRAEIIISHSSFRAPRARLLPNPFFIPHFSHFSHQDLGVRSVRSVTSFSYKPIIRACVDGHFMRHIEKCLTRILLTKAGEGDWQIVCPTWSAAAFHFAHG